MVPRPCHRLSDDDVILLNGDEIENEEYWDASEHFEHEEASGIQLAASDFPASLGSVAASVAHSVSLSVSAPVSGSPSVPGCSSGSDFASSAFSSASPDSDLGLPEGCSNYLPSVTSDIWNKFPSNLVTDSSQPVDLNMDPDTLVERKAQFSDLALQLLQQFKVSLAEFAIFSGCIVDWSLVLVTFFSAVFLLFVDERYWVRTVLDNTLPEFIYLCMAPQFEPKDLLQLPRFSKKDNSWGIYVDILVDESGKVVAWYFGSALSFGNPNKVCGCISRILSYFSTPSKKPIAHEEWLRRKDLTPNFRKVALVRSDYANLHKVYWLALETLFIVFYSFDTSLVAVHKFASKGVGVWVQDFREKNGIQSFQGLVKGLNKALPLKQGVYPDQRFLKKKCCNPIADCPAGANSYPMRRFRNMFKGQVFTNEMLCSACDIYFKWSGGRHRPQNVIDGRVQYLNAQSQPCAWCFRYADMDNGKTETYGHLNLRLCDFCGDAFSQNKGAPPPIPGLHFDGNHQFECQDPECTKQDKSLALAWFFRETKGNSKHAGYSLGDMRCEECQYRYQPKKQLNALKSDSSVVLHAFSVNDLSKINHANRYSRPGYLEYCRRFCNVNVTGKVTDFKNNVLRLQQDLVDGIRSIDIAARDRWFQELTTETPDLSFKDMHVLLPESLSVSITAPRSQLTMDTTLMGSASDINEILVDNDETMTIARKGNRRANSEALDDRSILASLPRPKRSKQSSLNDYFFKSS